MVCLKYQVWPSPCPGPGGFETASGSRAHPADNVWKKLDPRKALETPPAVSPGKPAALYPGLMRGHLQILPSMPPHLLETVRQPFDA